MNQKYGINLNQLAIMIITLSTPLAAELMKCQYGDRGSLTATCINATPTFFRSTSYRFDSLDETVKCQNCNLETIESNTFDISGNQIQNLDLSSSNIVNVRDASFIGLVFLKSLNLTHNQIKSIHSGVFKGIKKLETLLLRNNSLTTLVSDGFKELESLRTIDLSENNIKTIELNAFNGMKSLYGINLNYNEINDYRNIFTSQLELSYLKISHNQIDNLYSQLKNLTRTYNFDMSFNNIKKLPANLFLESKPIYNIDISSNAIEEIDTNAFHKLINVYDMKLQNNSLKTIEKGTFLGLNRLSTLDLSRNKLETVKSGIFSGLSDLRVLNLSRNHITSFTRTGISILFGVHTLDLSYNNLTDFDYKILYDYMPKLTYLGLEGNQWPCYLIKEMDDYFKEDNIHLSVEGWLRNDSCLARHHVHEAASIAQEPDFIVYGSYASASVVYTFIAMIFFILCGILYIQFRMDQNLKLYRSTNMSTSHVNLVSRDLEAHDNEY